MDRMFDDFCQTISPKDDIEIKKGKGNRGIKVKKLHDKGKTDANLS